MPNILENYSQRSFQPSGKLLYNWLSTRKKPQQAGGFHMPGLFTTDAFTRDLSALILVFIIELAGFFALYTLAMAEELVGALLGVGILVLDFIFAYLYHIPVKVKNWAKNAKALSHLGRTGTESQQIETALNGLVAKRNWYYIWGILIWVTAGVKCYFFYVGYDDIDTVSILIFALYFVAAAIHVFVTGYVFAEFGVVMQANKERKIAANAGTPIETAKHEIFVYQPLQEVSNINGHSIQANPFWMQKVEVQQDGKDTSVVYYINLDREKQVAEGADLPIGKVTKAYTPIQPMIRDNASQSPCHRYVLTTYGLLSDDDASLLLNQQQGAAQRGGLAQELLRIQFTVQLTEAPQDIPHIVRNATYSPANNLWIDINMDGQYSDNEKYLSVMAQHFHKH